MSYLCIEHALSYSRFGQTSVSWTHVLQYRSAESLRELLDSALTIVYHNMHLGQVKVQLMHFMAYSNIV